MSATGVLRMLAGWMSGSYSWRHRVAYGTRDGVPVEVRFALRGSGYERTSRDRRWTEVEVAVPSGCPLSLHVRRHDWTDQHQIEAGAMVDVRVGDDSFDRQFLVEIAPAKIARGLLDPALRRVLESHEGAVLTTQPIERRLVVRLSIPTWLGGDAITAAVDALVRLSVGVRAAYVMLDSAALRGVGAPYRPQLDDAHVHAQRVELETEVALVDGLRAKR